MAGAHQRRGQRVALGAEAVALRPSATTRRRAAAARTGRPRRSRRSGSSTRRSRRRRARPDARPACARGPRARRRTAADRSRSARPRTRSALGDLSAATSRGGADEIARGQRSRSAARACAAAHARRPGCRPSRSSRSRTRATFSDRQRVTAAAARAHCADRGENASRCHSPVITWKERPARTIALAVSCAPWMPWLYVRSAMSHAGGHLRHRLDVRQADRQRRVASAARRACPAVGEHHDEHAVEAVVLECAHRRLDFLAVARRRRDTTSARLAARPRRPARMRPGVR